MYNLDLQYAWISVSLSIALYVFFLLKAPSANFLLGFTVVGLGGVMTLPPYTYARLTVALQVLNLLWLSIKLLMRNRQKELLISIRHGWSFYSLLLAAIWIKIVIDCDLYGMDSFRTFSLKAAIYNTFLPLSIIYLSAVAEGPERCIKGIVWGLCLYPCAYFLPVLIPILIEQRIWMSILGVDRLTIYGLDTINGGKMFFFGYLGFICYAMQRSKLKPLAMSVAVSWFILIILNGTRQYLLASVVFFLMLVFSYGSRKQFINLALLCAAFGGIYWAREYFIHSQLVERIEASALATELTTTGRGEIWKDAWIEAAQHPFTGVGFRNFGTYNLYPTLEGEIVEFKDNAHGFFQDIMVEHGFVFLAAMLAAWTHLLWSYYIKISSLKSNLMLMNLFLIISFCILELFSCGVFNAWGHHSLMLVPVFYSLCAHPRFQPAKRSPFPVLPSLDPSTAVRLQNEL